MNDTTPAVTPTEYQERLQRVREELEARQLRACVIAAPENVFYLTGLHHQGYFAPEMLVVPLEGEPWLVTRAMEAPTVADQVPWIRHVGYSDGIAPLPPPADTQSDLVLASHTPEGDPTGLRPWEMSVGVTVEGPVAATRELPIATTVDALREAGLDRGRLGIEQRSAFLPYAVAAGVIAGLPDVQWEDVSGLVDDIRIVQSPAELELTRTAAAISDSMMLAAIAAAGAGVLEREIMAASYDMLFRRGGTYPGFVPLIRSTRTLRHEHGTMADGRLRSGDILFLEMSGCTRRYHAPMGRLVFVDRAPARASRMAAVCEEALLAAAEQMRPGVEARDVYQAWQRVVDRAGLDYYHRHHCGYAVGIGFPPSWSGSGVPRGLRRDSRLVLQRGMVFHLMSWLLRTGRGDYFLSDTVVVQDSGAEFLTQTSRAVTIR